MTGHGHNPWLQVLAPGGEIALRCGRLQVYPAPAAAPPFAVEAVVREDDTWLVLSAATAVRERAEHPVRLHTELLAARPAAPGSVLVRSADPLELLAVVHDLDVYPSCRPEWVAAALHAVLREVRQRGLECLALPLLGSVHRVLSPEQSATILASVLPRTAHGRLRRLWLQVPATETGRVLAALLAVD